MCSIEMRLAVPSGTTKQYSRTTRVPAQGTILYVLAECRTSYRTTWPECCASHSNIHEIGNCNSNCSPNRRNRATHDHPSPCPPCLNRPSTRTHNLHDHSETGISLPLLLSYEGVSAVSAPVSLRLRICCKTFPAARALIAAAGAPTAEANAPAN